MTEPRGEPGLDLDVLGAALKEARKNFDGVYHRGWIANPVLLRALDAGDALLVEVRRLREPALDAGPLTMSVMDESNLQDEVESNLGSEGDDGYWARKLDTLFRELRVTRLEARAWQAAAAHAEAEVRRLRGRDEAAKQLDATQEDDPRLLRRAPSPPSGADHERIVNESIERLLAKHISDGMLTVSLTKLAEIVGDWWRDGWAYARKMDVLRIKTERQAGAVESVESSGPFDRPTGSAVDSAKLPTDSPASLPPGSYICGGAPTPEALEEIRQFAKWLTLPKAERGTFNGWRMVNGYLPDAPLGEAGSGDLREAAEHMLDGAPSSPIPASQPGEMTDEECERIYSATFDEFMAILYPPEGSDGDDYGDHYRRLIRAIRAIK